ncbi:MAG TPA: 2-oxoacid:acceptor oxidoreductase subunit alpha [Gemmatimonadales bacterium]|nr:2-oxoacid:acceptor oxidoreductase subunit alpha [Gemmatimonadales bacterium]
MPSDTTAPPPPSQPGAGPAPSREQRDSAVIRFAGDSGDGMQITGSQFTLETALAGNDLATFPDYPAEIRAPAGTTFGVSAFQIHFGAVDVLTAGDELDVLVAMNPAALKVNLKDLRPGGVLVADQSAFTERNLTKAGYQLNPLEDGSLTTYQVLAVDIDRLTTEAVKPFAVTSKQAFRCRNMWALGLLLWMYDRERQATIEWLQKKFADEPEIAQANVAALNAGHAFGETAELPSHLHPYRVAPAAAEAGTYRTISGTEGIAWGLLAGLKAAGLERMVFASYPITPASPVLHTLAGLRAFGVVTFQAEDEIAAVCAAIGASYAGALGVTSSSGPGISLKTEALGLAIATELPLVVIDSQRAGPSTGLPTKTEQSDLYQAVLGRNADAPMPVLAAATPSDCFAVAMEAVRLATKYMTPVFLLSDGYLANAAEPWRLPDVAALPRFPVQFRTEPAGFHPYVRDPQTLARAWAVPGTPGLEHRIGGIERSYDTGHISYDPENHERMTKVRAAKVAGIANDIPEQDVALGDDHGALAVVGWGSTYGPIHQAVRNARADGLKVSHVHLRYLAPFPRNLGELLARFDRVLVPEMNNGQLVTLLRAAYLIPAEGLNQITGKPFKVSTIQAAIRSHVNGKGKGRRGGGKP